MKIEIEPFEIKVNPEQSRIIQKVLFQNNYDWVNYNHKTIQHTNKKYLSLDRGYDDSAKELCYIPSKSEFESDQTKEITFEYFLKTYAPKEYRKLKILQLNKKSKVETIKEELVNVFEKFFKK